MLSLNKSCSLIIPTNPNHGHKMKWNSRRVRSCCTASPDTVLVLLLSVYHPEQPFSACSPLKLQAQDYNTQQLFRNSAVLHQPAHYCKHHEMRKHFSWFSAQEDRKGLKPRRHSASGEICYLKYVFLLQDGLVNGPCLKYFSIKSYIEVTYKKTQTTSYIFTLPCFNLSAQKKREEAATQSGSSLIFTCVALHCGSFSVFCTQNDASSVFLKNVFTIRSLFTH